MERPLLMKRRRGGVAVCFDDLSRNLTRPHSVDNPRPSHATFAQAESPLHSDESFGCANISVPCAILEMVAVTQGLALFPLTSPVESCLDTE